MPIKQVTCCKCNSLVNKAVTYSIGQDQRACKSHEGVVERKGELEAAKIQQRKVTAHKLEVRKERQTNGGWQGDPRTPRCWVCMNEGLRADEFFMRVLVEREKFQLENPTASIMDLLAVRPKERCIFILTKDKCANAMKYVRDDFKQLVEMGGVLAVCGPCCGTFKIQPLKEPTPDQLRDAMVVATIVKPVIEEAAKAELAAKAVKAS